MKEIVPDPAETEIEVFPPLDLRVPPPADDSRGLGENHLAPLPEPHAPEIPPGAEEIAAWDNNPVETGRLVPRLDPEDEAEVDAVLTEDGLDEAERDLRKIARQNTPTVAGPDDI